MLCCDNFWHKDAHWNVPSPACLMFILTLRTNLSDFKWRLTMIETWLGIQQSVIDQAMASLP